MIPDWVDLVVWGHEHESRIEAVESDVGTFRVVQPAGSSVATSLVEGESVAKKVACMRPDVDDGLGGLAMKKGEGEDSDLDSDDDDDGDDNAIAKKGKKKGKSSSNNCNSNKPYWFNIFTLHQNRDLGRGSKNCVHER